MIDTLEFRVFNYNCEKLNELGWVQKKYILQSGLDKESRYFSMQGGAILDELCGVFAIFTSPSVLDISGT